MATRRRTHADPDRLTIVRLHVAAERLSRAVSHDGTLRDGAVTALRQITERPDLLAEESGLQTAYGDRLAGELLKAAGAAPDAIPGWIEVGKRRQAKPPHSAP